MIKKLFFILTSTLIISQAHADEQNISTWQQQPKLHKINAAYSKESAVIIEDNVMLEFKDESDKELWLYRTTHRIVKILDERGLENFNKMTFPINTDEALVSLKARTILANGSILEMPDDKIKRSKEEDGSTTIAFAMEGVEKNAEVEILFCYKKHASLFGKEYFQFSFPVLHATLELSSPSRLKFEEKGYNGFPTTSDTLIGDTRKLFTAKNDIPSIQKEAYSFLDLNRMKAEYKVSYLPLENISVRVFTWQSLVQRMYTTSYKFSDREIKVVEQFLSKSGVTGKDNEEEKIRKIETAIKTGITIYKDMPENDAKNLQVVIDKKSGLESSIVRLFSACLMSSGVKYELGITTNRTVDILDPDFENWNLLEHYIYYFPVQKKFLSPTAAYYRYPYVNPDVLDNKGVFCKLTTLGEQTNAIADIRTITQQPATESQNNIAASLSFTADMDAVEDVSYSFSGYCAMGIRELAVLVSKEKQKELVQNLLAPDSKPENILTYSIDGEGFENYYSQKPVVFSGKVQVPQLVEKAGTKYLLKVGDMIGKQSELYQTAERKMPVDIEYPHYLYRTITINIPEGFKVVNPETIKMNIAYKNEQQITTTAFLSDYKIDGQKMTINISEFYTQLHFPIAAYEDFRKVVNASADFNKVTLLLDKI